MPDDRNDDRDETNLGITPYRGQGTENDDEIQRYYDSREYKAFEDQLRLEAEDRELEIMSLEQVAGIWEEEAEPAASVWLRGDAGEASALGAALGSRFDQDAVFQFTLDTDGDDVLCILPGVRDLAHARELLGKLGVPGGRYMDGTLEFGVEEEAMIEATAHLAAEMGVTPEYAWGEITILTRDEYGD
jgi:hypothetical protein